MKKFVLLFIAMISNLTFAFCQSNVTTTGGTSGNLPYFNGTTTVINSVAFQNSNKIGIGTTSPGYTLDVVGTFNVSTYGIFGGGYVIGNTRTYGMYYGNTNYGYLTFPSNYNAAIMNANLGIGTTSPAAKLTITQTAAASGTLKGILYTGALNTNQTASTEIPSVTFTTTGRQWAGGNISLQREVLIVRPSYSFTSASTISDAASLAISGSPTASTNASLTNTYGLWILSAAVSASTNSYGLSVNAQTGATNNYAASFLGGNVGIGTATPTARLDVKPSGATPAIIVRNNNATYDTIQFIVRSTGYVEARDVLVKTSAIIPDYVFNNDYNLPSLAEVENYISQNKHLPDVPSAADIKNNGLNVADMDAALLKKIEELTLYVIDLKKQNEEMQKEINALKDNN